MTKETDFFLIPESDVVSRFERRPSEHAFTYRYSQPSQYHFCLDSIILSYFVSKQLRFSPKPLSNFKALDLCAGCGVVGIELSYYHPWILNFDFIEKQEIFSIHFEANLKIAQRPPQTYQFLNGDFKKLLSSKGQPESSIHTTELKSEERSYDLIVSNPPYFYKGEGIPPTDDIKNRARFFLDATAEDFYRCVQNSLKPHGRAYFLARSGEAHGRDVLNAIEQSLLPSCTAKLVAWARTTAIFEIKKI